MRMIAGSILILAAAVLGSAYWIGQVLHNSTVVGSPEGMYLLAGATFLGLIGAALSAIGTITDREKSRE